MGKKVLYIDMDNTLVNFPAGVEQVPQPVQDEYKGHADEIPGVFELMTPMDGAIEAFTELAGAVRHVHPVNRAVVEPVRLAAQARVGAQVPRG